MNEQTFPIWLNLSVATVFFVENYIEYGLIFLGVTLGLIMKAWYEE